MKIKSTISIIAAVLFLLITSSAYCGSERSYDDTVDFIKETMASSTSSERKESYGPIKINKCILDYNVSGTFPAGGHYNITYSAIDFSSLNYQVSKAGHDYTAFIILNFSKDINAKDTFKELTVHTVVINVSTDENAQLLFKAFLHLGELCGAPKGP